MEPYAAVLISVGNPPSNLIQLFLPVFIWFPSTWTADVCKEKEALKTNRSNGVPDLVHPTQGITVRSPTQGITLRSPQNSPLSSCPVQMGYRKTGFPKQLILSHFTLVGLHRSREMFLGFRAWKGRKEEGTTALFILTFCDGFLVFLK